MKIKGDMHMYHWKNNKKTVIFIQVIFMLLFTTACGGKEPVLTVQTEQERYRKFHYG